MLELFFYEMITSLSNRILFLSRTLVCNVRQHTRRIQRVEVRQAHLELKCFAEALGYSKFKEYL